MISPLLLCTEDNLPCTNNGNVHRLIERKEGIKMCAIAGLIGLPPKDSVSIMLETMKRRGPDGQGTFVDRETVLLHTRLAVIDPAGGKQPMELFFKSERYTITYNGNSIIPGSCAGNWKTLVIGLLQILIRKWFCTPMPNMAVIAFRR
jgi:hypothetical protein